MHGNPLLQIESEISFVIKGNTLGTAKLQHNLYSTITFSVIEHTY